MDHLRELLIAIDDALREAGVEATFVGGAVIPLLLDAVGAEAARATLDVDCIVETTTHADHADLEARLEQHGFAHCMDEGAPICRWTIEIDGRSHLLDVMPSDPTPYGFSNRFFPDAARTAEVLPGTSVRVVRPAYALATKIDAWQSRGKRDFFGSKDFEDLVALFDGCPRLIDDLVSLTAEARQAVAREVTNWTMMPYWEDVISGNVPPPASPARVTRCLERMRMVAGLAVAAP